jgi:hypothetical protein
MGSWRIWRGTRATIFLKLASRRLTIYCDGNNMRNLKFPKVKGNGPRGFSDWHTVLNRHLWECCDCSLVHEYQFKLVPCEDGQKKAVFRVRRARNFTARQRAVRLKANDLEKR